MFTTVNSDKKNFRRLNHIDAKKSSNANNPDLIENYLSLVKQLADFFSIDDDYLILQLSIFADNYYNKSLILKLKLRRNYRKSLPPNSFFNLSTKKEGVVNPLYL